jgi:DNA-binding NarL/FixJ family response regulator
MPRHRVEPVGLLGECANTVAEALRADGMEPCGETDLPAGDPVVVICGWPGRPAAEQRRRARRAVRRLAGRRVVLVTELTSEAMLERLVAEGVHGVVPAAHASAVVAPTVRAVAAGQLCVPARSRGAFARRPLSLREREILAMVIMGLSNGEIASRLHLAESTVKSHLVSTFAKLGVRSRAEAVDAVADPQHMLATGIVALAATAAADGDPG